MARPPYRIASVVWLALLLGACSNRALAPIDTRPGARSGLPSVMSPRPAATPAYHAVRSGDTLSAIARRYGLDYRQLARWNGIRDLDTIYPGTRLRLKPPPGMTAPAAPAQSLARATPTPRAPPAPAGAGDIVWQWPARGRLVQGTTAVEKKGINIAGSFGQAVVAAAAGKVVYSGSGLIGYGQLIIVKHDESFLSAYANNSRLVVAEGERVAAGQKIAEMGASNRDQVMLHFEIRRDGEAVDPLRYLPGKP